MDIVYSFAQLVVFAFLALLPVVNPFGTALIIEPLILSLNQKERQYAAKKIALNCLIVCIVALFIGSWILKLFGLSIPIIQLAGGILIAKTGMDLLNGDSSPSKDSDKAVETKKENLDIDLDKLNEKLFYPYSFPIMTGAGTISVLFTLAAQGDSKIGVHYFVNMAAIIVGVLIMMFLVYICVAKTHVLVTKLGTRGTLVIGKVSAFLILGVGLQIFVSGVAALVKLYLPGLTH
ncbi:hypothetical protein BKH43_07050 [Helicobacter sp. 13S00401-1]|uniref:MarC family protein n=1 Tax=Helicobacter sp. 13S00401-1 TaxID=1905758 RepID=UPI000BA57A76|nr:MarC family protein [Helicobacter sp. 13S00401-1]PAF49332.1 hypothetical protein BKH43_07050 [Helicobacter sp. 13S00401-1]